jgi:hypothetical protein
MSDRHILIYIDKGSEAIISMKNQVVEAGALGRGVAEVAKKLRG